MCLGAAGELGLTHYRRWKLAAVIERRYQLGQQERKTEVRLFVPVIADLQSVSWTLPHWLPITTQKDPREEALDARIADLLEQIKALDNRLD